ncbi:MAG TPA: chromate transporter [Candidatus Ornithomonoglobus intestinigallinarum]|uniref:Chromate transporter n=1 Tax=Candidatus Ornithomonoglobus intestinigallinarum TaxID=2840894 RepID=A0A9D1H177_9FIRM|nr:chromate transporter [Candidatus Ornithomonoglobus intestinigallinarum]
MIFLTLFLEFFKIGLFSVGGGLATIPFLQDIAGKYDWFDISMLGRMIAIAESTPGPVGINMATYAGFQAGHIYGLLGGIAGGFTATMGIVVPALVTITLISKAYRKFKENPLVENAFYGVRPVVAGMIASSALLLVQQGLLNGAVPEFTGLLQWLSQIWALVDFKAVILFAAVLVCVRRFKLHPIIFIAASGVLGALLSM